MPAPRQSPHTITPFGNYLLDELIAEGGMARVYRARLRGVGGFEKPLVVKQVRPELASDPRFVGMFVEEAKTLVRLSHPHIVPVYELGVVDGTYFLAMDLVEGATLSAMLAQGPLAAPLVARVGWQTCDALQHAHERFNLVHRDVTPRNVLIDAEGQVRLVDFGIATPAEGATGEVFGSPGYMSPEQLRGEALDGRSDLFTLGALLFECLTGEPAFLRRERDASRRAILEEEPPRLPSHIPEELAALVHEMIARDVEARPAKAADVAKRLRAWLAAHHPEGAGTELGARAQSAMEAKAPAAGPITVTSRKTKQEVRTLATSAILAERRAEPQTVPGTERIEREAPAEPEVAQVADVEAADVEAADVDAPRAPTSPRRALALTLAAFAIVAGVWAFWPQPPVPNPPPPTVIEPDPEPPTSAMEIEPVVEVEMVAEPVTERVPMAETPRAVPTRATVQIGAVPFARVTFDRRNLGDTPIRSHRAPPGQHIVILDHELGQLRVPLRLRAGERVRINANFYATPPTYRVVR